MRLVDPVLEILDSLVSSGFYGELDEMHVELVLDLGSELVHIGRGWHAGTAYIGLSGLCIFQCHALFLNSQTRICSIMTRYIHRIWLLLSLLTKTT